MPMARAISASVTVKGGVKVSTLPNVVLNDNPRSIAAIHHLLGLRVGRRLAGAVGHQFDPDHQPAPAHVADQRMFQLQFGQALARRRRPWRHSRPALRPR